jgi:serine/threonine-protein kinase
MSFGWLRFTAGSCGGWSYWLEASRSTKLGAYPRQDIALTGTVDQLKGALAKRFTLEKELGRGGMAIVYLARDLRHKRLVALKVLHPELSAVLGPERFLREVETAAGLQHPHILPVFDSGEAGGLLWYTMPYVEGESLRQRLKREVQLPIEDAIRLSREVAETLDYAHRHGVVHRDIKPDNILLTEGHALVADFGIAKAVSSAGGEAITQTGTAVGTPSYMSPEQASPGAPLDGRSDIYSLGCVLYEMLAGEPPFTGPSSQAIIARHCADPPRSMRVVRPGIPLALERAVERALAKVPADRFQTAGEFARSLASPEVSSPSAGVPVAASAHEAEATSIARSKPVRHRRVSAGLAALAIGVLLGLAALLAWFRTRPEAGAGGAKRLAVLPFENLGYTSDAYFAEGIAGEIRGKLAGLPVLTVIASTSSNQYRHTTKAPHEIAQELGVQYLLVGRVQWEKQVGSARRVRVSPELVEVGTGATRWHQSFDAALTDVLQVQAEIAERVAQALDLALGAEERQQLTVPPTQNPDAYKAYLQALDKRRTDYPGAAASFEHAVALDSSFALAWAELALTRQDFFSVGGTPQEQVERSKADAERALALNPKLPRGFYALGKYYLHREEYDLALAQYARGLAVAPNDVGLLSGVAEVDLQRGQWERVLQTSHHLQALDPRSVEPVRLEGKALLYSRQWREALVAFDRALTLDSLQPWFYADKMAAMGALGDNRGIQEVLHLFLRRVGYSEAVEFIGRFWDQQWQLPDSAKAFLLGMRPSAMDGDTVDWALTLGLATHSLGQPQRAKAYADTALRVLRMGRGQHKMGRPALCLAYGLTKNASQARHSCGQIFQRPNPDATWRGFELWTYAWTAMELGDFDRAVTVLERMVESPGYFSPGWLRIDPTFASLRGNPRFERLVKGK